MRAGVLSPLAVSVLALLCERPMHPYEMYQLLLARNEDRIVKVRPGSLYHAVARVHERDFVEEIGTDRGGNRPERTTYRITPAGRRVLTDRLAEILRTPMNEYPEFVLGLSEMHNLPAADAVALLRGRIDDLTTEIQELSDYLDAASGLDVLEVYVAGIRYRHHMMSAEVAWLVPYTDRIDSGEFSWPHEISNNRTALQEQCNHRTSQPDNGAPATPRDRRSTR